MKPAGLGTLVARMWDSESRTIMRLDTLCATYAVVLAACCQARWLVCTQHFRASYVGVSIYDDSTVRWLGPQKNAKIRHGMLAIICDDILLALNIRGKALRRKRKER